MRSRYTFLENMHPGKYIISLWARIVVYVYWEARLKRKSMMTREHLLDVCAGMKGFMVGLSTKWTEFRLLFIITSNSGVYERLQAVFEDRQGSTITFILLRISHISFFPLATASRLFFDTFLVHTMRKKREISLHLKSRSTVSIPILLVRCIGLKTSRISRRNQGTRGYNLERRQLFPIHAYNIFPFPLQHKYISHPSILFDAPAPRTWM